MSINITKAAVVGGGVIGAGWIARLLENSIDVHVYDPDPEAQRKIDAVLSNAEAAYEKLTAAPRRTKGKLTLENNLAAAVSNSQLIVESVPEDLAIKQTVYAQIEESAPDDAIITSSTSGIMPSDLQARMRAPERLIVAHPFNPVYLLPMVELVGGSKTSAATVDRTDAICKFMGMRPLRVKKEIDAFIADRLLESVWREALWLVRDGVATTEDIDDAIRFGFGLRWAQMGLFETYRIAGGEAGMKHFLGQFGPTLSWPWTRLMNVPELTDELVELISSQSDEQSGKYGIRELEQIRDTNLVSIMQALKDNEWGAGLTLDSYEKTLFSEADNNIDNAEIDVSRPIETVNRRVPADWTDYNGHMNESRYLQCFSDASDYLMRLVGVSAEYIKTTGSYFTVETHIQNIDETTAGEQINVQTQIVDLAGKKLHVIHSMYHADGRLLATGEHMLLHVSLETRRATEPAESVLNKATEIATAHKALELPNGTGRFVGQARS
ncbi:MAG: carnitine 3-dehydrogenase [Saprospiraceae bacterium]|jgi:carnitine 3-dehydrogenase